MTGVQTCALPISTPTLLGGDCAGSSDVAIHAAAVDVGSEDAQFRWGSGDRLQGNSGRLKSPETTAQVPPADVARRLCRVCSGWLIAGSQGMPTVQVELELAWATWILKGVEKLPLLPGEQKVFQM